MRGRPTAQAAFAILRAFVTRWYTNVLQLHTRLERGLELAVRHLKAQELRSTYRRRLPRCSIVLRTIRLNLVTNRLPLILVKLRIRLHHPLCGLPFFTYFSNKINNFTCRPWALNAEYSRRRQIPMTSNPIYMLCTIQE